MQPKISIIVPVCNVESYLDECLSSIINQTMKDIEIICINDGSTDNSLAILKKYSSIDSRIIIIDKQNAGYGAAMNDGLDVAQGEYIGILESDDFVCENSWLELYNLAKTNELDVVKGCYWKHRQNSDSFFEVIAEVDPNCPSKYSPLPYNTIIKPLDYPRCFWMNPSIWSALYKTRFLQKNNIRFNETPGASYQDTSFSFKVWSQADKVMFVNNPILYYRIDNEASSTNSKSKVFAVCDEMDECEKYIFDNECDDSLSKILCALRYKTYIWNLARIGSAYKAMFIQRAMLDFRKDLLKGNFDNSMFTDTGRELFFSIAGEHVSLNRISQSHVIFRAHVDKPLVTVIVPFYNQEIYLSECIDSVLSQTLSEWELILIDDGSTDSSLEIAKQYLEVDNRISLYSQNNLGQSAARNIGLQNSKGEYIFFLDSDDMMTPEALETLYYRAKKYKLDVLLFEADAIYESEDLEKQFGHFKTMYKRKKEYSAIRSGAYLFSEMEFGRDYQVSPCLSFVSRRHIFINKLKFEEGIIHEDNLWTFQLLLMANRTSHISKSLYIRRVRSGSTMTTKNRLKSEIGYLRCLNKMIAFVENGAYPYPVKKSATGQFSIIAHNICNLDRTLNSNERAKLDLSLSKSELKLLYKFKLAFKADRTAEINQLNRQLKLAKEARRKVLNSNAAKIGRKITFLPKKIREGISFSKKQSNQRSDVRNNNKNALSVLFVAGDSRYSGASFSLVTLVKELREYGEDARVILPGKGPIEKALKANSIPYKIIPSKQWAISIDATEEEITKQKEERSSFNKNAIIKIKDYIRNNNIKLVHSNTIGTYVGAVAAEEMGVPHVWHIREFMEEDHALRFWDSENAFRLIKQSKKCICISDSVYNKFAPILGKDICQRIYNGIDIDNYYCLRKPFSQNKGSIELTVCGNFEPGKAQLEAVRAVGEVIKNNPSLTFHLNLLGQHFKKDYVSLVEKEIMNSGIESYVYMPGARSDMAEYWANTDIAIIPSRHEAFGRCTIEAMLSGAVVVGADIAGTDELIEDELTGFKYKHGDYKSLAYVLQKVLSDIERARNVSVVARETARITFSSDRNSKEIYSLHKDIISNSEY